MRIQRTGPSLHAEWRCRRRRWLVAVADFEAVKAPYDPRAEELFKWAYDATAAEPVQDWDLALEHCPYESLYIEFASSSACPKQGYFLAILYLIVGDAVRTRYQTKSRDEVETLLVRAEQSFKSRWLQLWVKRSRELMANPDSFQYEDWCTGALAKDYER